MNRFLAMILLLGWILPACGQLTVDEPPTEVPPTVTPIPADAGADPAPSTARIELDLEQVDRVPPQDILEEIQFFVGGGGGPCYWPEPGPHVATSGDPQDTVLTYESRLITCEWETDRPVDTTIVYPDGRIVQKSDSFYGYHVLELRPQIEDPEGLYILRVSQNGTTLESNVAYRRPVTAVLYYERQSGELQLNNFLPGEEVRLLVYELVDAHNARFVGSREYTVDEAGDLVIHVPVSDRYFYAVLDSSGLQIPDGQYTKFVHMDEEKARERRQILVARNDDYRKCPAEAGSSVAGHETKDLFLRTIDPSTPVYANPRTTSRLVTDLDQGSLLRVQSSAPYCVEGAVWWQVDFHDAIPRRGFVMERDLGGEVLLEVFVPGTYTCGAMVSRLLPGRGAQAADADGAPLDLRESAGFTSTITTSLEAGTTVYPIVGPRCLENSAWWKVRTPPEPFQEGWMAEYRDGIFLLEPVP